MTPFERDMRDLHGPEAARVASRLRRADPMPGASRTERYILFAGLGLIAAVVALVGLAILGALGFAVYAVAFPPA